MTPALHPSKTGRTPVRSARLLLLAMAALALFERAVAQPVALTEYSAKAALLFNIAKYADWPATAFAAADSPIVIGVLGDDPFGDVLDRIVRGRLINGRALVIRRAGGIAELKGAHLVFVSPAESHAAQDCAVLEEFHVLTVGDTGQTALFTALNFAVEGNKIVFTVDLNRAARARVTLSSKLLNLAKAVKRATNIETR
jgi:hypothetical protein